MERQLFRSDVKFNEHAPTLSGYYGFIRTALQHFVTTDYTNNGEPYTILEAISDTAKKLQPEETISLFGSMMQVLDGQKALQPVDLVEEFDNWSFDHPRSWPEFRQQFITEVTLRIIEDMMSEDVARLVERRDDAERVYKLRHFLNRRDRD